MKGLELFHKYTSKRDYSGSPEDVYAQLLDTIHFHIRKDIYPLLEKAEKQNKKLEVNYPEGLLINEIDEGMISLV